MLIPTEVYDYAALANPGPDYWCKTAAHFYINPPGVSAAEACVWGSNQNDYGNWSPYVAGTNTDDSGQSFIKLGWNPIYLEPTTPFRNNMPDWGVRIDCPDGKCNGLPCEINPKENFVNQMKGSRANGAGGGAFCVVTVPKGSTANFVVFGGSGGGQFPGRPGPSGSSDWNDASMTGSATASSTGSATTGWDSSSTWEASNSTTYTSGPNPSNRPNKDLFNTAAASSTTAAVEEKPSETASPTGTPSLSTGGTAQQQWSMASLAIALIATMAML